MATDTSPRSADVEGFVRRTNDLLASRVPLTLLMDLAEPEGPHSKDRFAAEGGDLDWLRPRPPQD